MMVARNENMAVARVALLQLPTYLRSYILELLVSHCQDFRSDLRQLTVLVTVEYVN